jgi:hypothetical protein
MEQAAPILPVRFMLAAILVAFDAGQAGTDEFRREFRS